jgi:hypothetical protein
VRQVTLGEALKQVASDNSSSCSSDLRRVSDSPARLFKVTKMHASNLAICSSGEATRSKGAVPSLQLIAGLIDEYPSPCPSQFPHTNHPHPSPQTAIIFTLQSGHPSSSAASFICNKPPFNEDPVHSKWVAWTAKMTALNQSRGVVICLKSVSLSIEHGVRGKRFSPSLHLNEAGQPLG